MINSDEIAPLNLFDSIYVNWEPQKPGIFNTPFENMLRILLLLETSQASMNIDRITSLDFLSIYGRSWDVLDENLHGNNRFDFAEFTHKRTVMRQAICMAVKNDFIEVVFNPKGIQYKINDRGKEVASMFNSEYANEYRSGAAVIIARFSEYSDVAILEFIHDKANVTGANAYAELFD